MPKAEAKTFKQILEQAEQIRIANEEETELDLNDSQSEEVKQKSFIELFNLMKYPHGTLPFKEQLYISSVLHYNRVKHRRIRMLILRLIYVTTLIGSLYPVFETVTQFEATRAKYSDEYGNILMYVYAFLFIWNLLESTFADRTGEFFFLESLIPDFGYDTRQARKYLEENIEYNKINKASDYSFDRFVNHVDKQISMYWRRYDQAQKQKMKKRKAE